MKLMTAGSQSRGVTSSNNACFFFGEVGIIGLANPQKINRSENAESYPAVLQTKIGALRAEKSESIELGVS